MSAPLVLSHRGRVRWPAAGDPPDNARAALASAFEAGADGAEVDVRLAACGTPVLVHDRLAPDGRLVAELDRDELDAALGHPVAALGEVLREWPDRVWNVELKTASAVDATAATLRASPVERVLVTSFDHDAARRVGELADVPFGYLIGHRPRDVATYAERIRADGASAWVWHAELLDLPVVEAGSSAGLETWVYGLLTAHEHEAAVEMGVDAIVADDLGLTSM